MVNAGYEIIASVPVETNIDIVIGHKTTSIGECYVCWFCKDKKDFYWGNYCTTYRQAIYSLIKRLNDYYPGAPK